ncbi:MAG: AAA family ATPase [Lewinellaceae bacterium]|nr:AAA family ATPase [Lewinellaceae bacterium]
MQKLVIKSQFMGVKPCEIELRRFLLLIGEQASGKSTIAKLIYFFQTLPDAIYNNAILTVERRETNFNYVENINLIARMKFEETFGAGFQRNPFELCYYYSENSYLKIGQAGIGRGVFATFMDERELPKHRQFGYRIGGFVRSYIEANSRTQNDEILRRQGLKQGLYACFDQDNSDFVYMIAGRNTTVAFPKLIEEKVTYEIEKIVEDAVKQQDFEVRRRTGNEMLFLKFIDWAKGVRNFFQNNGGTFTSVSDVLGNRTNRNSLTQLSQISFKILKGEYRSDAYDEYIKHNENDPPVALKDASSGQQEVLRVLQGLALSIGLRNRSDFMVVEEPEAHLYPLAQKELINAFAVFLNAIKEGRLIITTHSPYILACVNILLLAHFVNKERGGNGIEQKISEAAVPKDYWLDPADFTAYAIGHSDVYCRNIKDDVTGLVAENYLDSISEVLGMQYRQLYDLLTLSDA